MFLLIYLDVKLPPPQMTRAADSGAVPLKVDVDMDLVRFDQARKSQKSNPAPQWHKPPTDGKADTATASYRYSERFFRPALAESKFTAGRDENFFMMGSCFARGLESALANRKFNVLSRTSAFDRWLLASDRGSALGATNKYNLASIRNEFTWALTGSSFPHEALIALDNSVYSDPHMTPVFAPAVKNEVLEKRQAMTDLVQTVRQADVIIITLGLVEVWKDTQLDLVANATPHPLACRKQPDRFQFGRLSYAENLRLLEEVYDILLTHARPGFRIVITVSPVPLESTFTSRDVVEATTYSKSLLRVVAEDFATNKVNVEYFPSYEIVMNSPRENAWIEDCRHVRGELANFIIENFIRHYIPNSGILDSAPLVTAEYVG